MIKLIRRSTKAIKEDGMVYNYRNTDDVRRFLNYIVSGNSHFSPIFVGQRGSETQNMSGDHLADDMLYTQTLYNKERGIRIWHFILIISDYELTAALDQRKTQIIDIAERMGSFFYYSGFQVAYSVFHDGSAFQIHYAVNSVSFEDGSKFRYNEHEIRGNMLNCIYTSIMEVTGRRDFVLEEQFMFESLEYYPF